jgi:nucleotide-binding universal stress UspA family protein
MAARKILVPYNFTRNDEKAIAFVIERFNRQPGTRITLFHAYIPVPEIDISDKTVMSRLAGNLAYLRQKNYELEEALEQVQRRLVEAGFDERNIGRIFKAQEKEIAQEIIEQAAKGDVTTLVLNHNPSKIKRYFTPSVTKKVARALKEIELSIVG